MKTRQPTTNAPAPVARELVRADEFVTPSWMDCTWRRVPCGQMTCPVCGRQLRDRARHIARGEDPDSLEAALADITENFAETMTMITKEAARLGLDIEAANNVQPPRPPQPSAFPLYRLVAEWCECTRLMLKTADMQGAVWVITEHFDDLMWYTHTLQAKTYRQLTNAWEREHTPELYGESEHAYTRRVLNECCGIMAHALREILPLSSERFLTVSKCSHILAHLRERLLAL